MSDETPQHDDVEKVEQPAGQEDQPKMFDETYVKKLRDEAASYRVKLKEYEDAQKTEAEKMQERLAAAEARAQELEKQATRAEWLRDAAKDTGLPLEALEVIHGEDRDSFLEAAKRIKSLIPENDGPQKTVVPIDVSGQPTALNGSGIEDALKNALGIK